MKNLIIILGTVLLGAVIVNTLILGGEGTLQDAASDLVKEGTGAISDYMDFGDIIGGA
ncbi:MAG: hypothetical protein IJP00_00315 [Firmicutes bacterium]|nr:hypothetical protein [Bacillota bacterium]